MFVHLLLGNVSDREGVRGHWDQWHEHEAAATAGWLGSVGGVTADGRLVLVAFSESAGEPPEWWSAVESNLHGPPTVLATADVTAQTIKDAGGAGFVQLMRAAVRDRGHFEATEDRIGPAFVELRPDFLAGYRLWFEDGTLVALDYFSSEAAARAGEAKSLPDDLAAGFREWQSLLADVEWYDLTDPWLALPH